MEERDEVAHAPQGPRWWVSALVWFGIPALLFVLALAEENVRGRWMLQRAEHAMRADGDAFSLGQNAEPSQAPPENGAPAVIAAANELKALAANNRLVSFGPRGLMKAAEPGKATCAYRAARFPSSNGYRAADRESANAADDWVLATAQLASVKEPLDRLRAALGAPVLVVQTTYTVSAPEGSGLLSPDYWLLSHAVCALHTGDLDGAIGDILAVCALGRLQRTDFHLVAQRLAETTDVFTNALIWEALQANGWTQERLERLQAGVEIDGQLKAAVRSCEVERALAPDYFDSARRNPAAREIAFRLQGRDIASDFVGDNSEAPPSDLGVWVHSWLWDAAWSFQDEARCLEMWREFLPHTRTLAADQSWTAFGRGCPKPAVDSSGIDSWRWSLSELLTPASGWYLLSSVTRTATERDMAVTAIALKRYELEHGKPADSLQELTPKWLHGAPLDYMTGEPLRYRLREGGGFTLYSVGLDGRDDGGDPTSSSGDERVRSLWGGRDAVWPTLTEAKPE